MHMEKITKSVFFPHINPEIDSNICMHQNADDVECDNLWCNNCIFNSGVYREYLGNHGEEVERNA